MTEQYRKIAKYTKSSRKYMAERRRRRDIIRLHDEGFNQAQIAQKLNISARTVQRDWRKLHGYIEHLKGLQKMKFEELLSQSLNRVPTAMRFELLGFLMFADKKTQNRAVQVLLAGNIEALRRMLRRKKLD